MNRAALRNLGKSLPLCIVESAFDMNIAGYFFNETAVRNVTVFAIFGVNA